MKFYPPLFSLGMTMALAGCGQMGPLYLPVEPVEAAVKVPAKTPDNSKPVTTVPATTPAAGNAQKPKEK